MFGIYNGLYTVGYFGYIVAGYQLAAFRVTGGYLRLTALFQLLLHIFIIIFAALVLFYFLFNDLFIVAVCTFQLFIILFQLRIYIGFVPLYFSFIKIIVLRFLCSQLVTFAADTISPYRLNLLLSPHS